MIPRPNAGKTDIKTEGNLSEKEQDLKDMNEGKRSRARHPGSFCHTSDAYCGVAKSAKRCDELDSLIKRIYEDKVTGAPPQTLNRYSPTISNKIS
jgi:hypothetical protein